MKSIVVSGVGAVTPFGINSKVSFDKLMSGVVAFEDSKYLDIQAGYFRQKKVAEVDLDVVSSTINESYKGYCIPEDAWATKFSVLAIEEALHNAGMSKSNFNESNRIGIALTTLESEALENLIDGKDCGVSMEMTHPEYSVHKIREIFDINGPSAVLSNACASGNHAIAAGCEMIHSGEADVVIVGGACKLFKTAVVGFHQFKGIANDTCRPFDKHRSGTMLGDGAGILILESEEHARIRGHKAKVVVSGVGMSCDAHDMSAPHPQALGMKLCMERAMYQARMQPEDIQYIAAHGTATFANDRLETLAINDLFGDAAKQLMVSSTKSQHGHCLYAASAVEAVWCIKVLEDQRVPGTLNYKEEDEECNLDYITEGARRAKINAAMNNSFGFGGANGSVIFSKFQ